MFTLGYYSNDDPKREVTDLATSYENVETARHYGKDLAKHPAFSFKTVVILDHTYRKAISL